MDRSELITAKLLKRRPSPWVLGAFLVLLAGGSAWASVTSLMDMELVHDVENAEAEHVDQDGLRDLVASGQEDEAFEEAFELGYKLFGTVFNALDGSGANVGTGQRFTRVPRADLKGPGRVVRSHSHPGHWA